MSARTAGGLALGLLLAAGCARIEPPPGGPPDEEPPRILEVRPLPGSVDQPGDVRVEILFDEYVDRRSAAADLVFSPTPPGRLRVGWRGRRMLVDFDEDLPPDVSWLLELGTGCADLQGNRLPSPLRLPFATGPVLDTLEIAGRLHGFAAGDWAEIWAWPAEDWPTRAWTDPPRRTRPDSDGLFRLLGLDARGWRLLAVDDANRDGAWNPLTESAALASADGRPGQSTTLSLRLGDGLLLDSLALARARFLDPLTLALDARLDVPGLLELAPEERGGPAADSLRLATLRLETLSGEARPLAGLRAEPGGWRVALAQPVDSVAHRLLAGGDTLALRPPARMALPDPVAERPEFAALDSLVLLAVDRAVLAVDGAARQTVDGDTLDLPVRVRSALVVELAPARPGGRALLPAGWLSLAGGGAWPDSATLVSLPAPRRSEATAGALEWSFDRMPWDPTWRMVWTGADGRRVDRPLERAGRLDDLAEGPALLDFYQDRNGNGRWDPGRLSPWTAAELWIALPDTFEVIAGWTVGGLEPVLPVEIP